MPLLFAYKTGKDRMSVLNLSEHEIHHAHNVKMPTNVDILTFMSLTFMSMINTHLSDRNLVVYD